MSTTRSAPRAADSPPDLMAMLHATNPYDGFDASAHPLDLQGWNGTSALFGRLIEELAPRLVIEVGTWKGQSAINMARHLQRLGHGARLLCIDTWLGSVDFWQHRHEEAYRGLGLRHGYPTVYYQFLANVVHTGTQDVIVPFPATSTIAARLLIHRGVQADLIYVDAAHEENDVILDLTYYWHLLRPGGVMFGDDYRAEFFPGVVRATADFCARQGLDCEVIDGQYWLIRKPADAPSLADQLRQRG